ncbi:MAG: bacillithiol biosynthesis cysteine-adding enzyme BshC [Candidatus Acidiferrales bacterium]
MEYECLRFSEIPQTTELFASYTEAFAKVKDFYGHAPDVAGMRAAAKEVRLDAGTRNAVVDVLRAQNREMGSDAEAAKNIDRLGNGAVAIVTGQQVSLFSGPAYSIYKALDAIHWAKELTRSGIDAVPIFWMATEDHDLAEANQAFFGERYGIARLELLLQERAEGGSVGRILLGNSVDAVVEHAVELLQGAGKREIAEALKASYRQGETLGSAFGKLLARVLKGRGLILLDPLDKRLHELARPVYRKAVEDAGPIAEDLLARGKDLERKGFHAQVKVTQQSTLVFLDVDGKREPVRRKDGGFIAGGLRQSASDMLRRIDEEPRALTASVLLRPVLQDSILPTAAYIGGPAEVAYMAQVEVVYRRVLGRMPTILPRASFTLIEPEVSRALKKYHLNVRDVLSGRQQLRRRMEAQYLPRGLAARFARDEKMLRKMLAGYGKPLGALDRTLGGARETAERKMFYQFEKLRGKVGRAENRRTGVLDRHELEIVSTLYPRHGLQERTLCLLPFLAHQGTDLLDRLESATDEPCQGHRLISL